MLKKGQEVTGVVERVLFPNRGMVRVEVEGETALVQVKNVIRGQTVRIRITKKRHGNAEGRLLAVEQPSPIETAEEVCAHFPECGGCLYQTLPYKEQLSIKEEQIRELLVPVIGEERYNAIYEGISGSPVAEGYRNKMELTFGDCEKDGELMLGLHRRGFFYDILPTVECRIEDADMRTVQKVTLAFFRERGISYYHKRAHKGYLRHLLLRKAKRTGELLIDLVTSTDWDGEQAACQTERRLLEDWRDCLLAQSYEGRIVGILHTQNDRPADVVEDQGTEVLYGQDFFREELLGLSFTVTPFSFFQTNSLGAEVLYEKTRELLLRAVNLPETAQWMLAAGEKVPEAAQGMLAAGEKVPEAAQGAETANGQQPDGGGRRLRRIYDLYSGTGTIAQILAPIADEVIGVEIVEEAVEAAKENAARNGLTNCRFIVGDVLKILDDLAEKPDFIVLDPPRDGVHPKALPKILSYGVAHILYISCKATSLARDLPVFHEAGYREEALGLVDLFPGTGGVETVCLLGRRKPDDTIKVSVNMDDYYQIRDAEEAEKNPS